MELKDNMKKGTTTLGLVCKDGIVLAADKRATAGNLIADPKAEKIHMISDNVVVTLAGVVSDAQLLIKILKAEVKLRQIRSGKVQEVKGVANLMSSMVYSNIRRPSMMPGITHFIMAGRDASGMHLYDLFPDGTITLIDNYVASGSGSVFAYGLFEAQYDKEMNVDEAADLAVTAINSAVSRDIYSGNGIDVVKITSDGIERLPTKVIKTKAE